MRAAIFSGPGAVEAGDRPDPDGQVPFGSAFFRSTAYRAMDERRAIKSLVRVGTV